MYNHLFILIASWLPIGSVGQPHEPMPHFIYVYDPLCGWCYGFSPVICQLREEYAEKATFEVIAGGMIRGDRVGPLSDMADYIRKAYKDVEETSGIRFGQPFLDELFGDADMVLDSEPGCLAQAVINHLKPEQAVAFASSIQNAIYSEGMHPGDQDRIIQLLVHQGLDRETVVQALSDDQMYQRMINGFSRSEGMGVRGFPTLFLEMEGQRHVVSRGFIDLASLQQRLDELLAR
ncbi:MAG: DsbA family protein [Saprospiraceae bacterium]|nr:DsbA family protein [Saprospiraceae bacterium]